MALAGCSGFDGQAGEDTEGAPAPAPAPEGTSGGGAAVTGSSGSTSSPDAGESTVGPDVGDTTVSDDGTTGDHGCDTWCDGYPSNQGCDEEDDGVAAEDSGGGGSTGGAEDTGVGMGDDFPLVTSVYELQLGDVPVGEYVQLDGVIVTSPAAPVPGGVGVMFTVEEPEGGMHSGITVRAASSSTVESLQPGDVVSVLGDHHSRYVFSLLSLSSDGLTVTGTASMPPPVVVPADEIEAVSAGGMDAKPLESVLIRVLQPEVVDPRPCAGEIEIQAALRVDDRFLATTGESLPTPEDGGFSAIVGPLLYTYNGFEVAPRSLDDFEN